MNLAELPAELNDRFGFGLLQLFYCIEEDCDGDGWKPFSDTSSRVRIVTPEGKPRKIATLNKYDPKRIVGWEKEIDYPSSAEHDQLGIEINYHFNEVPFKPAVMTCKELGVHFSGIEYLEALEEAVQSQPGDKLGGWPSWIQGVEYPQCPKCRGRMNYVFQIDSEDNLPFMFGDCSIGHVTQCATHKDVVAFGWACS